MPYRRLPNTDQSRIEALAKAIKMAGFREGDKPVLSYEEVQKMEQWHRTMTKAQGQYKFYYEKATADSKEYRNDKRMAQMYLSHYMQVFNMCIERGELKAQCRVDMGIDINDNTVPNLNKSKDIVEWGERIIKAEELRGMKGGKMIYNPTLAKVKVYWSIFCDKYFSVDKMNNSAQRYLDELTQMRPEVDEFILNLWNRIEAMYAELPGNEKYEKAKRWGIRYYMRTSEKKRAAADALQRRLFE